MIFESHAHYDDRKFDEDREILLGNMAQEGIGRIVNIGADLASTKRSIELAQAYDFVYAAAGVHPSDVGELNEENYEDLVAMAGAPKVVAIGEIGLDYYWEKDPAARENQKYWFRKQLQLARDMKLPVVIHSRDAAKDTMDMAIEEKLGEIGGVVHCYSYSVEMARQYLDMGMYLGIGGVLTFKNSKVLKEVAAMAPMDRILLETDCPYLAPEPFRGKRNNSAYLKYVVSALAQIKGITEDEVMAITWKNACDMYRLPIDL